MKTLRERFEDQCFVEPGTGCWIWIGEFGHQGHAEFGIASTGKVRKATKVSWEIYNGPITGGLLVLSKCDSMICVNPEHLFLGMPLDDKSKNDFERRETSRPLGEKARYISKKLSVEQINLALKLLSQGELKQYQIAARVGTSAQTISNIKKGYS